MRARYVDRTSPPCHRSISWHVNRTAASMSIKDWPVSERPREKLLANGAQSLSDAELLAVLLGASGRRGLDAVAMARGLLSRHRSLRGLLSAQRPHSLGMAGTGAAAAAAAAAAAGTPGTAGVTVVSLGTVGYC